MSNLLMRMAQRTCLALLGLGLSACGRSQFEWKEEVQLQTGEVLVVKRTVKTKPFGEIGGADKDARASVACRLAQRVANDAQWRAAA